MAIRGNDNNYTRSRIVQPLMNSVNHAVEIIWMITIFVSRDEYIIECLMTIITQISNEILMLKILLQLNNANMKRKIPVLPHSHFFIPWNSSHTDG